MYLAMLIRTNRFSLSGTRLVLRAEVREQRLTGILLAIICEVYFNDQIGVEKLAERLGNENMRTSTIAVHKNRLKKIFGFAPILFENGVLSVPPTIKILKLIDNGLSLSEQLTDLTEKIEELCQHVEEIQQWITRHK